MNIQEAKEQIKKAVQIYLMKDSYGAYRIPIERQRPVFLLGAPGIGKTAVMEQIAQEGAIQIFRDLGSGMEEVIVGVVGVLQLEVLEYRLRNEYNVDIRMQTLPYEHLRWIMNDPDELDPKTLDLTSDTRCIEDLKGNHLLLFGSPWSINWAEQHNEQLKLSEFGNLTF